MADADVFIPWERETADHIAWALDWTPEEVAARVAFRPHTLVLKDGQKHEREQVGLRLTAEENERVKGAANGG